MEISHDRKGLVNTLALNAESWLVNFTKTGTLPLLTRSMKTLSTRPY